MELGNQVWVDFAVIHPRWTEWVVNVTLHARVLKKTRTWVVTMTAVEVTAAFGPILAADDLTGYCDI